MKYFIDALKNYAVFTGRASRTAYWMFMLMYVFLYLLTIGLDIFLGTGFLSLIYALLLMIPSISVTTRRLHDTSRSGWWQLISLIPIVGLIILVIFLCQDSHEKNKYGINPKYP